jgi:hypothetical protein
MNLLKISSIYGLINNRNTIPMFNRVQSEQVLPMINYRNTTSSSASTICYHCKNNPAEIFQESGEFCLHCWQEITYPNV